MSHSTDSLPTASLAVFTNSICYQPTSPISSFDTPGSMLPHASLTGVSNANQLHLPPIVIPALKTATKPSMTDGFMLFCASQTTPFMPVVATPALYDKWNTLSNESKLPYHRQAIIVNTRSEGSQQDTTIDSASYPPRQLVSPEAIRSAQLEEKEEALGQHPFSAYSSFLSMKHTHEKQQFGHDIDHHSPSSTYLPSPPICSTSLPASMTSSHLLPPPPQQHHSNDLYGRYETTCTFTKSTQISMATPSNNKKQRSNATKRLKRPPNAYLLFNRDMRRKLLALDPKLTVAEISKEIGDRWKYLSPDERQHYMDAAQDLKQDHLKNHPDFIYTRRSKAELAEAKSSSKAGKATVEPPLASPSTSSASQLLLQMNKGCLDTIDENPLSNDDDGTPTTEIRSSKKHGRRRSQVRQQQRDPRGRKKKQHRHPSAPKHPMSGFLFFLGAVRPQVAQQFPGSTVGPISKEISSRWKSMSAKDREPWLLKAEADKARYAQEIQVYMANLKQQEQPTHVPQKSEKRIGLTAPHHGNTLWTGKQADGNMDDQMIRTTVVQTGHTMASGSHPPSNLHYSFPSTSFDYPSK